MLKAMATPINKGKGSAFETVAFLEVIIYSSV